MLCQSVHTLMGAAGVGVPGSKQQMLRLSAGVEATPQLYFKGSLIGTAIQVHHYTHLLPLSKLACPGLVWFVLRGVIVL